MGSMNSSSSTSSSPPPVENNSPDCYRRHQMMRQQCIKTQPIETPPNNLVQCDENGRIIRLSR
jgi:hypothetical protein